MLNLLGSNFYKIYFPLYLIAAVFTSKAYANSSEYLGNWKLDGDHTAKLKYDGFARRWLGAPRIIEIRIDDGVFLLIEDALSGKPSTLTLEERGDTLFVPRVNMPVTLGKSGSAIFYLDKKYIRMSNAEYSSLKVNIDARKETLLAEYNATKLEAQQTRERKRLELETERKQSRVAREKAKDACNAAKSERDQKLVKNESENDFRALDQKDPDRKRLREFFYAQKKKIKAGYKLAVADIPMCH